MAQSKVGDGLYVAAWIVLVASSLAATVLGQDWAISVLVVDVVVLGITWRWRRESSIEAGTEEVVVDVVRRSAVEAAVKRRRAQGYGLVGQTGNRKVTLTFERFET